MKLEHESHQLHFLSQNADIEANSLFISAMTQSLGGLFSVVPITGKEYEPAKGLQREFLILTSPEGKVRIEFPSNEIVISHQGGSIDSFQGLCKEVLSALDKLFPMKLANRLSVITNRFYSGSTEHYDDLYRELFTYKSVQPFEWDNRIAQRLLLEKTKEEINSISAIRRLEAQGPFSEKGKFKDVIVVDIDSNTIFQNNERRFSLSNSIAVLDELFENTRQVTHQLNRYFS